ncbi:hypothetical protein IGI04_023241, partial [Brassica rapa subsp. trilocularis]
MWFVVTGGHRNSLSLSNVRAVVTEGLRRRGGCSREWEVITKADFEAFIRALKESGKMLGNTLGYSYSAHTLPSISDKLLDIFKISCTATAHTSITDRLLGVSDPASTLRDLAKGRRDGREDSSDLNLPIVAEVASSWSQLCQSWWVSTASEDWPVEEVCPDNLHISGEVHRRLLWVAMSWCGCRRSGFNRPGELEIPAVEGGDQVLESLHQGRSHTSTRIKSDLEENDDFGAFWIYLEKASKLTIEQDHWSTFRDNNSIDAHPVTYVHRSTAKRAEACLVPAELEPRLHQFTGLPLT